MALFIPLRKVDAAQRLVYGRIDEAPDRAGEVFDYASSKPEFEKWSKAVNAATSGKSLGNVRAMHGAVAAGKLVGIQFDDATKSVEICAHIVDDAEWAKVDAGVYTGFSPGGRYLKQWKDGEYIRYTAAPSEISIVDLPCIPSATFTMVKADGASEERPFSEAPLNKAGARHSAADLERLQSIHDHAASLGACCGGDAEKMASGDLAKAASDLAKVQNDLTMAKADLVKLTGERDTLKKRVEELEARPADGGPVLKVFDKGADISHSGPAIEGDDLSKIEAMPPGPEKTAALRKYSENAGLAN